MLPNVDAFWELMRCITLTAASIAESFTFAWLQIRLTRLKNNIQKNNFEVKFGGNKWVTKWICKREPIPKYRVGDYKIDDKVSAKFRSGIERWIRNG